MRRHYGREDDYRHLIEWCTDVFRTWFPRLATVYSLTQLRNLIAQDILAPFFEGVPFDASSINFTLNTATSMHRDYKNLAWGLCCIGPLGKFDHTTSAQLKLEEVKMIVEVCPHDLFFIPFDTIRHGNASIRDPAVEK